MKPEEMLEWLWANCKIVYWPSGGQYPVEHDLAAHKDMRTTIEHYAEKAAPGR
jgi:hypothetical protein